jgi:hypothetical protein
MVFNFSINISASVVNKFLVLGVFTFHVICIQTKLHCIARAMNLKTKQAIISVCSTYKAV